MTRVKAATVAAGFRAAGLAAGFAAGLVAKLAAGLAPAAVPVLAAGIAAAPAPAAASGPLFATREEAEAAFFVLERFLDGSAELETLGQLYADRVIYFDTGEQTRDAVLAYRREFFSRWSERDYAPDLSTLVVKRDGSDRYAVSVEVDFTVRNAAALLRGRSVVDLTVERRPSGFAVVREGGRVITQAVRAE